jgi:N-acetyl-gamma-glutamyl-phosphate reductase
MKKINVCIIGARSLSSGHLIKLLLQHKHVNINMLVTGAGGEKIQEEHPYLHGIIDKKTEIYNPNKIIENCDLVFLNKGHGNLLEESSQLINLTLNKGKNIKFIDLSADFRLKDKSLYWEWYHFQHTQPELLQKAVYGLTELYRDKIKDASLVANPGCYPTASLLAIAPLLKYDLVDCSQGIIIDAFSGVSGAGKSSNCNNLAYDIEQNIKPYKIGREHQHIPEIEQEISNISNEKIGVTFSPHVLSLKYGILSTNYIKINEPYEWENIYSAYEKMYENEPFIRLLEKKKYPEVRNVEGTNFCDIGFSIDKKSKLCISMSAIDNVIKGASGQAIQNMNVMYGFDETEGLPYSEVLKKYSKSNPFKVAINQPKRNFA